MIKNTRQYNLTLHSVAMFAEALARLVHVECPSDTDPVIHRAKISGMESQLETLKREIREYDALLNGRVDSITLNSLEELPLGLIKARIAAGLTQKQLAELIGVKPQQVQRWEHDNYENVGFNNLVEIAKALELNISEHIELPTKPKNAFAALKQLGIDKPFVLARLASNDAIYRIDEMSDIDILAAAASRLDRIYGIRISADGVVQRDNRLAIAGSSGRFKIPKNANTDKVRAYALYAHHLADIVAKALPTVPVGPIPTTWQELRYALCGDHPPTFEHLLRGAWGMGIAVLPLSDPIHFHGVCWRFNDRNVIILKQPTSYSSRWAFDLLHEIHHAGEESDDGALETKSLDATDPRRRESDDEHDANNLAGNILLNGQAVNLYQRVLALSNGNAARIKNSVLTVASETGVSVADLANYVAHRAKESFINWWGTAAKLQPPDESPVEIARKILLEHIDICSLAKEDRELLEQALREPVFH